MNKLKTKIAELKDHLGRDQRGVALLEEVTTIANEIRKELSSIKEVNDRDKIVINNLRQTCVDAVNDNENLRQELIREQSIRQQKDREVRELLKQIDQLKQDIKELTPEDLPELERDQRAAGFKAPDNANNLTANPRDFVEMFKILRMEMKVVPKPVSRPSRHIPCFEITHVVSNLGPNEMMKLGRFVATNALLNLPVCVSADDTLRSSFANQKISEDKLEPYIRWIQNMLTPQKGSFCYGRVDQEV